MIHAVRPSDADVALCGKREWTASVVVEHTSDPANRMTTPIEAAPQKSFGFEQSRDEAPARTGGTPLAGEGKARSNG